MLLHTYIEKYSCYGICTCVTVVVACRFCMHTLVSGGGGGCKASQISDNITSLC